MQIWSELTLIERQQFQILMALPPIARDFARRTDEAISYQSGAVAAAIDGDLSEAIHARKLAGADVVAIVGET